MAMLSLNGGRGAYGFGVRAMRPAVIAGRTASYSTNAVIHYDQPNGSFIYTSNYTTLNVYGADGNLSGSVAASAAIDGTGQTFVDRAMTYSAGYFWGFVKKRATNYRNWHQYTPLPACWLSRAAGSKSRHRCNFNVK